MKLSEFFIKTQKDFPRDEQSVSAQFLIRGGYIDKVAAGVYTLLPLGVRTVSKIMANVSAAMQEVGGQEIYMSGLVPKSNWEQTGRWDSFDILFRLKGADEREYALGATHEEIVTPLAKKFIKSYKDLPIYFYQIQNKFRNEVRAKSGVLRTREFLMKDLYSFHKDKQDLDEYYEKVKQKYLELFTQMGIGEKTYFTFASGGDFTKYSHEFQTEAEAGEDEVYVCKSCKTGLNREILGEGYKCPECGNEEYDLKKTIEVGNIFKLGTKFSKPFDLTYKDEKDQDRPVEMGCYGIGIQRLMGTIAEVNHDDKGLIWPQRIAPFEIYLISLGDNQEKSEKIYQELSKMFDVLWDDRDDVSAGEKFADADLLGMPWRVIVSDKTGDKIELKARGAGEAALVSLDEATKKILG